MNYDLLINKIQKVTKTDENSLKNIIEDIMIFLDFKLNNELQLLVDECKNIKKMNVDTFIDEKDIEKTSLLAEKIGASYWTIPNRLISAYQKIICSIKNNTDFSNAQYEILLSVFIKTSEIVRVRLLELDLSSELFIAQTEDGKKKLQKILDNNVKIPSNLSKNFEDAYIKNFKSLIKNKAEGSYKLDSFESIPKRIIKDNFIQQEALETYDFCGHATKKIDFEEGQGTLFFEHVTGEDNRKLYFIKSLSKGTMDENFIKSANIIIFYYYIVKCTNDSLTYNDMSNKNILFIMDTELLFLGDNMGYDNEHNKWLYEEMYKTSSYNYHNNYYCFHKIKYSDENKKKCIKKIANTIENILLFFNVSKLDSGIYEYKIIFKKCAEIFEVIKNDYVFKDEDLNKIKMIKKKYKINFLDSEKTVQNYLQIITPKIKDLFEYEKYTCLPHQKDIKPQYRNLVKELILYYDNKITLNEVISFNTVNELMNAIKIYANILFVKDYNIENIISLIYFDDGHFFKNLKHVKENELFNNFLSLIFIVFNNIHLLEIKALIINEMTFIIKHKEYQDNLIKLIKSGNELNLDYVKIAMLIDYIYPIMKGRHEFKMNLIKILIKYFSSHLNLLSGNDLQKIKSKEITHKKIDLIMERYKYYDTSNPQASVFLHDLTKMPITLLDIMGIYEYCNKSKDKYYVLQSAIEIILGNTVRNNPFSNDSIQRDLLQK